MDCVNVRVYHNGERTSITLLVVGLCSDRVAILLHQSCDRSLVNDVVCQICAHLFVRQTTVIVTSSPVVVGRIRLRSIIITFALVLVAFQSTLFHHLPQHMLHHLGARSCLLRKAVELHPLLSTTLAKVLGFA